MSRPVSHVWKTHPLLYIVLAGLLIRLATAYNTHIINPDGTLYIDQAKAIYFGQWHLALSCLSFLSNYPPLIAGAYSILHDWIVAARSISILFGVLTLIPLYLLQRRFFDRPISCLVTLLFAFHPVFMRSSVDLVREPLYWFFAVLGMYIFVCGMDKNGRPLWLVLSALSILLATWARVEATLIFIVSFIYIALIRHEKRVQRMVCFGGPAALLLMISVPIALYTGVSIPKITRLHEILPKITGPFQRYQDIKTGLESLSSHTVDQLWLGFYAEARKSLWLIALGTLLNRFLEGFFYPFIPFFALGLASLREEMRKNRFVTYLALLAASSMVLLYIHVLDTWTLEPRRMTIVMLPCSILAGLGISRAIGVLRSKWGLHETLALGLVVFYIVICGTPKALKAREVDKLVFKEIGQTIAMREENALPVAVSGPLCTQSWVSFYANLNYPGSICPSDHCWELFSSDYDSLFNNLKARNIRYFLWAEKRWPNERIDFSKIKEDPRLKEVGVWNHRDMGRMTLFEVSLMGTP